MASMQRPEEETEKDSQQLAGMRRTASMELREVLQAFRRHHFQEGTPGRPRLRVHGRQVLRRT